MSGYKSKVAMSDSRDSYEEFSISRQEWDTVVMRAQLELLQRVNRLVQILEKQYGECKAGESNEGSSVVETSKGI